MRVCECVCVRVSVCVCVCARALLPPFFLTKAHFAPPTTSVPRDGGCAHT